MTDILPTSPRSLPALNATSDVTVTPVTVEGPPISAGKDGDHPAGWREAVANYRAENEEKAPIPIPVAAEVKPASHPAAPAQAAAAGPASAAAPAAPAAVEAAESAGDADGPVVPAVALPPLVPDPVLLDTGEPPVQGRDESWQEFSARQVRYQARVTANENMIAETNAAIGKRNAEVRRLQEHALQNVALTWQERQLEAVERHPDFVAITTADDLPFTETMANHVVTLRNGADVAYHLGKHKAEARRIANLPVPAQIDAVARLSERLKGAATTKATPASRPASGPKAPAAPQRTAPPARASVAELNAMEMNAYAARRNEQLLAERRRC
jgi:hypothetical protein